MNGSIVIILQEMRACSFNLLLIALSAFDSGYLMGSILESFRKSFRLETDLHTYLFPYFLFPGMSIMMTASIFMTVAIAVERYTAVHYPIDYKQVKLNVISGSGVITSSICHVQQRTSYLHFFLLKIIFIFCSQ